MTTGRPVSRREFLKIAGAAGAIAGLGAGFGGIVGACRESGETSNTIATIAVGQTSSSTQALSGPETGREIKVGLVSAESGPLALFGRADAWWTEYARAALPEGALCGDGKRHRFVFFVEDSRSDPGTAALAADKLISEGKVDLITCSGSADLVNPVADRAEALGCPCLSSFHQWRPFVFGRTRDLETPFKWTYAHAIGLEDIITNYLALWEQVETNRKVGFIFADDANGRVWADAATGLPQAAAAQGYEGVLPGLLQAESNDYSPLISEFVKNGCEICCGAMAAADFIAFWRQVLELEYRPKIVTIGDALLFPQALEALGSGAYNLTAESLWQPDWPFTDSITGSSAQQLASDYMTRTGEQWIAPIAQYAKFEWAVDVFKRVWDLDNKDAIIAEVRTTKLDTCLGPIDFTSAIDMTDVAKSRRPTENVYKAPVAGVQWVKGDKFEFQANTVTSGDRSDLPVTGTVQTMVYDSLQ
jgi:branched-chain amino acid transport system substrate-binding protein